MIITEGIMLIYFRYFASPEEIMQARKIAKESMASLKWSTPDGYLNAAMVGFYSVVPTRILFSFLIIWYLIIPTIGFYYALLTASVEQREMFHLIMKAFWGC